MSVSAPPAPVPKSERRIAPRYQPAFGTVYRIPSKMPNGPSAIWLVWNLSETGMSLLVAEPLKPGIEAAGELTLESGGTVLQVPVRVVHVRPVQTGDYCVGAQFVRPLTADEMKPFLTPPPWPQEKRKS